LSACSGSSLARWLIRDLTMPRNAEAVSFGVGRPTQHR
jgi:hypothetical protein